MNTGNPSIDAILNSLAPPQPEPSILSTQLQAPAAPLPLPAPQFGPTMPEPQMGPLPVAPVPKASFKETLGSTLGDFMSALGEGLKNRGTHRGQTTGMAAAMMEPARQAQLRQAQMQAEQAANAKAAMEAAKAKVEAERSRMLNAGTQSEIDARGRLPAVALRNEDPNSQAVLNRKFEIDKKLLELKPGSEGTWVSDKVMVDGKPAEVLRKGTEYLDPNTKKPVTGRITPFITPIAPRQRGVITETAEAGLISQLNTRWGKATKDIEELYRATTIMDAGMAAARRGDLNAGSQAVLVTFQKFLDPTSVVRESEYARSGEGQAMMARVRGYMDRLSQGGAGVPIEELQKFADLAKEINNRLAKEGTSLLSAERGRIARVASRYDIPDDLIFSGYEYSTDKAPPKPAAPGGWSVKVKP